MFTYRFAIDIPFPDGLVISDTVKLVSFGVIDV